MWLPRLYFIAFFILAGICSCSNTGVRQDSEQAGSGGSAAMEPLNDTLIHLTELRAGDILVKPNTNLLPGSAMVFGGRGFGHAVLVIKGAQDTNTMNLLKKVRIFESQARDVPPNFELRSSPGFQDGSDFRFANTTFGMQNEGYRYRLRFGLTPAQCDSIVAFVLRQDADVSCWRSQKQFAGKNGNDTISGDKSVWYCSLLIWEAFYKVLGVDLDPNGGIMVFPNDLIASPYFENTASDQTKRVRF